MEYSDMADVNIYRCFSTIIYEFKYHPPTDEYNNMKTHISETRQKDRYHTDDDLHQLSYFIKLIESIYDVA